MLIGLTDPMCERPKLELYVSWLKRGGEDVDITLLSHSLGNERLLAQCDALVLSGGGDIHPKYYGQPDALPHCEGVNEQRDCFELELVEKARARRLPILGICRGAQLLNVAFKGTLFYDIAQVGYRGHHGDGSPEWLHPIVVEPDSFLHEVVGALRGEANSYHHQSVDRQGLGLRISARSHDGVVEAIELDRQNDVPFLIGVQWHPERMDGAENPFSGALLRRFMTDIRS
ncbi:MAG: gamma-glutamyl-gamma-aminobutyrate hydrolase family protein [Bacteroidota bacterium]